MTGNLPQGERGQQSLSAKARAWTPAKYGNSQARIGRLSADAPRWTPGAPGGGSAEGTPPSSATDSPASQPAPSPMLTAMRVSKPFTPANFRQGGAQQEAPAGAAAADESLRPDAASARPTVAAAPAAPARAASSSGRRRFNFRPDEATAFVPQSHAAAATATPGGTAASPASSGSPPAAAQPPPQPGPESAGPDKAQLLAARLAELSAQEADAVGRRDYAEAGRLKGLVDEAQASLDELQRPQQSPEAPPSQPNGAPPASPAAQPPRPPAPATPPSAAAPAAAPSPASPAATPSPGSTPGSVPAAAGGSRRSRFQFSAAKAQPFVPTDRADGAAGGRGAPPAAGAGGTPGSAPSGLRRLDAGATPFQPSPGGWAAPPVQQRQGQPQPFPSEPAVLPAQPPEPPVRQPTQPPPAVETAAAASAAASAAPPSGGAAAAAPEAAEPGAAAAAAPAAGSPQGLPDDELERRHPLGVAWTLWYRGDDKRDGSASAWEGNLRKVYDIDDVETFWGVFNNVSGPSELARGSGYYLFKRDITPAWEDPACRAGGVWKVWLPAGGSDAAWLKLTLHAIGEQMDCSEDLCGVAVESRQGRDRLSLWARTTDRSRALALGRSFKVVAAPHMPQPVPIYFTFHSQALTGGQEAIKYCIVD
eukprot:TRINITY_DN5002_c0_g1_i2.p1 TRINITY_DN5002_c0_g1~~TRINITY_DN5002_c0_g1_i2.p1  ORF type:complete len:676 (+),score=96.40 TRINITY_DN5002_c0_g1_i2:82-2028(+)